ncbi:dephospho-CoA kinase [Rubrimonas cliftonensis]|uniref:Dephospho-CoA kinase n=1 Tax=Rubrimonas cliftonensis TaxID=89524 RepID=A0A1H3X7H8_9RHOB|nr:dephospho-CoA kinase [Rubrimonas cliftonensis]SDZ94592.1 dephospho-CoA kinase [Rubrimonas cliftonensis]
MSPPPGAGAAQPPLVSVGLTGSIGMGKSTVAGMFGKRGAALWDADAAVHRLYAPGGAGARAIESLAPDAVAGGAVDRAALRRAILEDPDLLAGVEAVIHPLVAADRAAFLSRARGEGARIAVCDVPLLFETGSDRVVDVVVTVSAPAEVQRARVLARPGMTPQAFAAMLARQTPDAEKRARADFVIDTGGALDDTQAQVDAIVEKLERGWRR